MGPLVYTHSRTSASYTAKYYVFPAALKFVNFVDPSLEQDIYADKPWALSPLVASMSSLRESQHF